jgi:RNA polymerase sigma-70 factor (ECF subfamily)
MTPIETTGPVDDPIPTDIDPRGAAWQLFVEHGPPLYRFCRSTLANAADAEDVVQETFLKLLQHLQSGGDRSNLRAWLFAVAANACRDRGRWRMRWLPWRAELDARTVAPDSDDDDGDRRRARAALRTLAPRDRMLIALRAQGLSYREIAAAAAITEPSVGRLLARAIDRWKRAVERT